ncbi:hypothetical protein QRX50_28550 [Amycolatopsis carbonis]|uniref:OmpR/PhoB-type domain-containing protein n=1 Tax=Amycolatopsis carbonis TaxID=715471 RepID=A0A9Y2MU14_9PSEU|nr:helix-turn-helix domain-containing protein [Amycolatopsis sp. 2-15]WIX75459.1 hypothetical protein QRX50_28550 [Amycolatopsis sp. 2-15]
MTTRPRPAAGQDPLTDLHARRHALTEAWADFFGGAAVPAQCVPADIEASWHRTRRSGLRETAPAELPGVPASAEGSLLAGHRRSLEQPLHDVAENTGFLVALAGPDASLVTARAGRHMAKPARRLNAVDGTLWTENAMGTNAVALALHSGHPVEVFTAQHANEVLHDWTCWAFPVRDPRTGAIIGAVDVSAPWSHHSGSGRALARTLAALVELRLSDLPPAPATTSVLALSVLGHPRATVNGRSLHLSPRQFEILTILALRPDGTDLKQLHAALYGDHPVAAVTLRAELSKLRHCLGADVVRSHPYHLAGEVRCDLAEQLHHVADGRLGAALELQRGDLLPASEAPFLRAMRDQAQVALRTAVLTTGTVREALRYLDSFPDDLQVLESACARSTATASEHALCLGKLHAASAGNP